MVHWRALDFIFLKGDFAGTPFRDKKMAIQVISVLWVILHYCWGPLIQIVHLHFCRWPHFLDFACLYWLCFFNNMNDDFIIWESDHVPAYFHYIQWLHPAYYLFLPVYSSFHILYFISEWSFYFTASMSFFMLFSILIGITLNSASSKLLASTSFSSSFGDFPCSVTWDVFLCLLTSTAFLCLFLCSK